MSFLDLLKLLNQFGPAVKANWADILLLVEVVKRIWGRSNPQPADESGILSVHQLSAEESAELDALADSLGGPTAQLDFASLLEFAALLTSTSGKAMGLLFVQLVKHMLAGK